jgi:hypothetical protein
MVHGYQLGQEVYLRDVSHSHDGWLFLSTRCSRCIANENRFLLIKIYDYHQTSAEYVLNNRSLWRDPYNCFQVIQDDERRRVGKRQFACPPVGIVVVSLTGGYYKAVLTAHDGNPAGVELEKIECTAVRSS